MIKKKVLLTATVQSHICQFHKPLVDMLREKGYEVHIAAKNNLDVKPGLKLDFADKIFDVPFSRAPLTMSNISAYRQLKKIILENNYDIIHCNTPMGGVLTRLAAREARKQKTKIIYTAHGFHFFKGAPIINWLVYYPVERFMSRFTDVLITINKEDYERAKAFHAKTVEYISGVGVDTEKFASSVKMDKREKRKELSILDNDILLLSIGELTKRKNHQASIRALAKLDKPNVKYVICGNGPLEDYLRKLVNKLGIESRVSFLGYRRDISEICNAADIFIFPSLQEGLPVALMEAMSCGLPVICSGIRGNTDLIEDGKCGYLISPCDVSGYMHALTKLMNENKREFMSSNNKSFIASFDTNMIMKKMRKIYEKLFIYNETREG